MEQLGKVCEWNDDRGFGFIAPLDGKPARVFFHVRDYRLDGRRPEVGELVKFSAQRQPDGKWRAQAVRRTTPAARNSKPSPGAAASRRPPLVLPAAMALIAYALLIGWAIHDGRLPFAVAYMSLGLSAMTFVAYALDKRAAQSGHWRTPESTLHLLELAGGWPGAWVAQRLLRHKSRKPTYRATFWTMVGLHCIALATWLWTRG